MSEMSLEQIPPAPTAPETPPWGDEFDPARAWHTIQTLRQREAELSRRPVLTPEAQQQLEDYNNLLEASQTDAERRERELEQYRTQVNDLSPKALRYEVALEHGISKDDLDLLGSGTREEIEARAVRIKALTAGQAPAPRIPAPDGRPVPQLRPGATPSQELSEEEAAYAALFGPGAK